MTREVTVETQMSADLSEFVEWGGSAWIEQVEAGVRWLGALEGLRVLEIGTRRGGMALYFATRGAHVTALDISSETFDGARARARDLVVEDMVEFREYSGHLQDLPGGYDVVFAKSTLVLMGDIDPVAKAVTACLAPGGRLLAIENARGPLLLHAARVIRRRSWRPHGASYFTSASMRAFAAHLDVQLERWTTVPPTVLIGAARRD